MLNIDMRLMLLITLVILSLHSFAQDKQKLTVVAEEWKDFTNKDLTGTYWDIIRAIYGKEYQLELKTTSWNNALNAVSSKEADIIIGVYQGQRAGILTPEYHIDMDSALYLLYNNNLHTINSLSDLANLTIAGREKYVLTDILPQSTKFYGVESVKDINKLIFNQRIDGALVFALDAFNADPQGTLSSKQLIPKRKMYLGFANTPQSAELMATFDTKMANLIGNDKIKPLYNEPVFYDFAGFNYHPEKQTISWQLIAKIYDKQFQGLRTTKQDRQLTSLLEAELPEYNFDIHLSSVRIATEELKNLAINTCAVGFLNTPERIDNYLFSLPIFTYIKPRIILLKENRALIPAQSLVDNTVNIQKLFSTSNTFRLASMENSNAYSRLKNILSAPQYERIVSIPEGENKNIIALLLNKRIDAIVLWPNEISDFTDNTFDASQLMSFGINESLGNNVNTYIACNNTPTNVEFIDSVNGLLQKESFRQALFNNLLRSLDAESAEAFMEQLTKTISTTPIETP